MEKLVHAKDIEELSVAVTIKQRKDQPLLLAKLISGPQPRDPASPPPLLTAPSGPHP
jgi:hypothetical protein